MKTKEDVLIQLKQHHYSLSWMLEDVTKKIELIIGMESPNIDEFFSDINKYILMEEIDDRKTIVLGGDGRSSPWDEEQGSRRIVLSVKGGYFLTEDHINIAVDYAKRKYDIKDSFDVVYPPIKSISDGMMSNRITGYYEQD